MKKLYLTIATLILMTGLANSSKDIQKPIKWQITCKKINSEVYDITCKAIIEKGWHLYDTQIPTGGPLPTTCHIDQENTFGISLVGSFKATTAPLKEYSEAFQMELSYFKDSVTFIQQIKLTNNSAKVAGYIEFMACSGGQCLPPDDEEFEFKLKK